MSGRSATESPAAFASRERAALAAAIARYDQLTAHLADTRDRARDGSQAARARYDEAARDAELVRAELGRLASAVENARRARDAAVAAVLSAAPGFAALVAELPLARQRVLKLENLFAELYKLPGVALPPHWDTPLLRSRPDDWLPDPALAALWRDAIMALKADATAPLPGGDPAPQAEAA
jgi:hypothetical protein